MSDVQCFVTTAVRATDRSRQGIIGNKQQLWSACVSLVSFFLSFYLLVFFVFVWQLLPVYSSSNMTMHLLSKLLLILAAFVVTVKLPRRRRGRSWNLIGKTTGCKDYVGRHVLLVLSVPAFVLTTLVSFSHPLVDYSRQGQTDEEFTVLVGGDNYLQHPRMEPLPYYLVSPTLCMLMASTMIHEIYYRHLSHKRGNLLIFCQKVSIYTTLVPVLVTMFMLIYPITSSYHQQVTERAVSLLPFLTGALTASMVAGYLASIADSWYAVGTGQFQMIAVDAIGIAFYFVLPLVVLFFCFLQKYGSHVQSMLVWVASVLLARNGIGGRNLERIFFGIVKSDDLDSDGDIECQKMMLAHVFVVLLLIHVITWGITLVNSQCPIAGYLYGRTYTHGRPNTKKIAVCVDYRVLFGKHIDAKEREEFLRELVSGGTGWSKSARAVLNINVTAHDLLQYRQDIEKLHTQGHELVITVDDDAPSDFAKTIRLAFDAYRSIFDGKAPSWYHPATHLFSSMPECYSMACSLGLRTAMWSNCIVSLDDIAFLKEGLKEHNGGLLVYVYGKENVLPILKSMMTLLQEGEFTPTTLSSVIPMDNRMDL
jgi:hypothetical protein